MITTLENEIQLPLQVVGRAPCLTEKEGDCVQELHHQATQYPDVCQ